jgi:tripartite-type tricarboxylate transporter receptor subunit TctC
MLFNAVNILVVPAGKPYRTVADLVADAKARPDRLVYGTGGVGSPGHLCGILFDHVAGTRTNAVSYRGGGPQVLGLLAGEQDFTFSPIGTLLAHIESGAVRPLAVATRIRARELPDVPTAIEAGLPGFEVLNWDALLAPRATPTAIRDRLGTVLRATLADPEVVTAFRRRGLEPWASDADVVAARIAADTATWQTLIRAAGIEPS